MAENDTRIDAIDVYPDAGTSRSVEPKARSGKVATGYDMSPVLFGAGRCARQAWFYLTEDELTPGAARVGNYKAVYNLRGDNGAPTGGLAVDSNLGWKGPNKYVETVPQERRDLLMNNFTERTWTIIEINEATKRLMKTYVTYPPRTQQSMGHVREQLAKEGLNLAQPTGNIEACRPAHTSWPSIGK